MTSTRMWAAWLYDIGYPFDIAPKPPVPEPVMEALIDLWAAEDATVSRDDWAAMVREEAGA